MTPPPPLATFVSTAIATADAWTRDVGRRLGRDEPDVAFGAIRGVLHAVRRRLGADQAEALSAALPTLFRGVFYEPLDGASADTRAGFLACVDRATRHAVRAEEAVRAVCAVLAARLPHGAWPLVRDALPAEVGALLAVPPHPDRPRRAPVP